MPKTMKTTKRPQSTSKRTRESGGDVTPPRSSGSTVGARFVKHVRTTRWYRSKLADRISKRHKFTRGMAHLAFGTMKIAGYAAVGAGVGAAEGTRYAIPHVRRHIKRKVAPKWARHGPKVERKRNKWRVKHAITCVCGVTFHDIMELNKHYSEKHRGETRVFQKNNPTRARRTTGKVKVRPASNMPTGRHRVSRPAAGRRETSASIAAVRKRVEERGKKIMSDGTDTAAQIGRRWTEIGDTVPRGTEDVMNVIAGLAQAASARGEALELLQKTLVLRLNVDPLVAKGLDSIIALAEAEAAAFTAVCNTIETIYGSLLELFRSGIEVPNS